MNKVIIAVLLFCTAWPGFADDIKQPTPPKPPTEPVKPSVPGTAKSAEYPRFPSLPGFPNNNQTNVHVQEIEKYDLNVSGAFPNGDTKRNVANTIKNAQYILYSNGTIVLKMFFINGSEYIYHLRNSRAKIEISAGVFRETFETIVQVGKEFLLEQYLSELCYDSNTITSLNLIGGNRVIVFLSFTRKT